MYVWYAACRRTSWQAAAAAGKGRAQLIGNKLINASMLSLSIKFFSRVTDDKRLASRPPPISASEIGKCDDLANRQIESSGKQLDISCHLMD